MAAKKQREYQCSAVNEVVKIHLRKKPKAGQRSESVFFVQCDQSECQYVDENVPPCPLTLSQFADEIRERDEAARERREMPDY